MNEERHLIKQRLEKLLKIKEKGVNPYPYRFEVTHLSSEVIRNSENLETSKSAVAVAGRLMSIRSHGKTGFGHIQDEDGKIQIYFRKDTLGDDQFGLYELFDIGDIVGIRGKVFKTRTGEITLSAQEVELLCKSIRPLPIPKDKIQDGRRIVYDEFSDKEQRYRQRYLDVILNPDVREVFLKRDRIIWELEKYLREKGFVRMETPILQPLYGGASARPFTTYHNALGLTLYLRISDELYLKRLIVGGYGKVYEFCQDFRNEGMDREHNPEFTLLELYLAYADYNDIMEIAEEMISQTAEEVVGSMQVEYQGQKIDFSPPWNRVKMSDAIREHTGLDLFGSSEGDLKSICKDLNVEVDSSIGVGKMIDKIFDQYVKDHLVQPTFITDYPLETAPLAKRHRDDPLLAERFEPFVCGMEIGNAFSELNDPIDQKKRFEEQMRLKEQGDEEAQVLDEDYIKAMEYGMPPTGGLGISIDRLVMLLTDSPSIRDVILFPQMRPEG